MTSLRACLTRGDPSQAANHEMDHRHLDHGFTGLRQPFVLFTQAPVAIEPATRALDDLALRDHDEPRDGVAAFGDLQADRSLRPQGPDPVHQRSGIGSIRPDVPEPPILVSEDVKELFRPIAILDAGSRHHHRQDQPEGIDQEMPLASLDLFARVIAAEPPFSVVFTDWLSRIPALGWRRLPAATRTSPRRRSCLRCQVPSFRQRQQYW
jgi:hypothetical protein